MKKSEKFSKFFMAKSQRTGIRLRGDTFWGLTKFKNLTYTSPNNLSTLTYLKWQLSSPIGKGPPRSLPNQLGTAHWTDPTTTRVVESFYTKVLAAVPDLAWCLLSSKPHSEKAHFNSPPQVNFACKAKYL